MSWNWQLPEWPHFEWNGARLAKAEQRFVLGAGVIVGTVKHLPDEERNRLTVEALSVEALTTSAIEGEILDRDSVQSSIQRRLGLAGDNRRVRQAEDGISAVMTDLFRNYHELLSDQRLFEWHRLIAGAMPGLQDIGRYRTHAEPMRVVSGVIYDPRVHFEAPPSERVPAEMSRFVDWFNRTAPGGESPLPALTRAGIAHLYFESIHPFEDGNGRVGRAIAEMALAQTLGRPSLTALAATILAHQREYYDALEAANKSNSITDWLAWFAGIAIEAQERALVQTEFMIDKTRLLDRFRDEFNPRQLAVLFRVLREGPGGFTGGLSAGKFATIAKTSSATATRDLADMVEKGALTRQGERKYARYQAAIRLRTVPRVRVDASGDVIETLKA